MNKYRRYMTEILPIRRKNQSNQKLLRRKGKQEDQIQISLDLK